MHLHAFAANTDTETKTETETNTVTDTETKTKQSSRKTAFSAFFEKNKLFIFKVLIFGHPFLYNEVVR